MKTRFGLAIRVVPLAAATALLAVHCGSDGSPPVGPTGSQGGSTSGSGGVGSGSFSGAAGGSAGGAASGSASGFASGSASGGAASGGTASGSASGAASGSASGAASGNASGSSSGSASGAASGANSGATSGGSGGSTIGAPGDGGTGMGALACGDMLTCTPPDVCCAGGANMCMSQTSCDAMGGDVYTCTGKANCPADQMCCVTACGAPGGGDIAQCQADCMDAPQVCQTTMECPNAMTCMGGAAALTTCQ
jgi:hypothetical protein